MDIIPPPPSDPPKLYRQLKVIEDDDGNSTSISMIEYSFGITILPGDYILSKVIFGKKYYSAATGQVCKYLGNIYYTVDSNALTKEDVESINGNIVC